MPRRGEASGAGREVLRNSIFCQLRDDILKGRLAPGEGLVEVKLASQYGVSRTPIREALRQLELEGLVRYLPNRGVVVEGITTQDVEDIFIIRERLESLVVSWAAQRVTAEELKKLQEVVELQEFYVTKDDVEQITVLDTEFHRLLLEASKSKALRYALGSTLDYVEQARLRSLSVPGRIHYSVREHRSILDALAARDAAAAAQRMAQHMANARANLLRFLSAQNDEKAAAHPEGEGPRAL
ncbi:MAG TPA: GntR family transcriptional regulator [Firmicutes bacterium]|nr:GntR family transcriptional regulator [Bacillota bacterium]